ncbi:MAG: response regulator [Deltaproteobacteria bacterium]|nr:response regulator [Deltaproteobacteria bacterium]
MMTTPGQPLRILMIEDTVGDAQFFRQTLGAEAVAIEIDVHERLATGLQALKTRPYDIVLLDLHLPESQGVQTFITLREQAPEVPIVVMTSTTDEAIETQAIQLGAQDYFLKWQLSGKLLLRYIGYAIDRHRLLREVVHSREERIQQLENELLTLTHLTTYDVPITRLVLGQTSIAERHPEIWGNLHGQYSAILERTLEAHVFKITYDHSTPLRAIAEQLGTLVAGPRDVIALHTDVLQEKTKGVAAPKTNAYLQEGRMLVLQLMGYLASYYRIRAFGAGQQQAPPDAKG